MYNNEYYAVAFKMEKEEEPMCLEGTFSTLRKAKNFIKRRYRGALFCGMYVIYKITVQEVEEIFQSKEEIEKLLKV